MNDEKSPSVLGGIIQRGYGAIFYQNWPVWFGGVLLGITSFFTFAWARPWGVAGGLRNWGDNLFSLVGIYESQPQSFYLSSNSLLDIGLLWGAFVSALLSKQFAFRMAPPWELFKGCLGGILMGIGAAMAGGCNVGGFYSAISALSLSGLIMMVGLFIGAFLGLKVLYFEMMKFPGLIAVKPKAKREDAGLDLKRYSPLFGGLLLLAAFVLVWFYSQNALTRLGVLLLCGLAFGIILHRSRFCFARSFREPMMTGDGSVTKGVVISLAISTLGFMALKWTGLRPDSIYVMQSVWFGSLLGGVIFGFGMIIAGGCGSGSVWRAGEGHVKLILAVLFFALSTSLFKAWIRSSDAVESFMGTGVYLPDTLGYLATLILLGIIFLAIYIGVAWNEETEKLVLEI